MSSEYYLGRSGTGGEGGSDCIPFLGGIYPPMTLRPSLGGGEHSASAAHVTEQENESQPEQNS